MRAQEIQQSAGARNEALRGSILSGSCHFPSPRRALALEQAASRSETVNAAKHPASACVPSPAHVTAAASKQQESGH
ncbi:hypothetical protein CKAH01_17606 [Colletotrichum kahawae]|uniref:Uncharacterized protein n=1 Tax=Colletotrichum kahawae TaxID=34407 RepID=A0AAE0D461_COLKA|nr:hypothetical protein CKAH01_17606 [Colletotrichum kahawae]